MTIRSCFDSSVGLRDSAETLTLLLLLKLTTSMFATGGGNLAFCGPSILDTGAKLTLLAEKNIKNE